MDEIQNGRKLIKKAEFLEGFLSDDEFEEFRSRAYSGGIVFRYNKNDEPKRSTSSDTTDDDLRWNDLKRRRKKSEIESEWMEVVVVRKGGKEIRPRTSSMPSKPEKPSRTFVHQPIYLSSPFLEFAQHKKQTKKQELQNSTPNTTFKKLFHQKILHHSHHSTSNLDNYYYQHHHYRHHYPQSKHCHQKSNPNPHHHYSTLTTRSFPSTSHPNHQHYLSNHYFTYHKQHSFQNPVPKSSTQLNHHPKIPHLHYNNLHNYLHHKLNLRHTKSFSKSESKIENISSKNFSPKAPLLRFKTFRLALYGFRGVGKSSIREMLKDPEVVKKNLSKRGLFSQLSQEAEVSCCSFLSHKVPNQSAILKTSSDIIDINFSSIYFCDEADIFLVVYSVDDPLSFQAAVDKLFELQSNKNIYTNNRNNNRKDTNINNKNDDSNNLIKDNNSNTNKMNKNNNKNKMNKNNKKTKSDERLNSLDCHKKEIKSPIKNSSTNKKDCSKSKHLSDNNNSTQRHFGKDKKSGKIVMLVANKIDLVRRRVISKEEGLTIATTYNTNNYIELSVQLGHGVDELVKALLLYVLREEEEEGDGGIDSDD